jgi:hypothetical protein
MFKRAWFLAVTLFWVTMNVLLWRSEMSTGKDAGSPLPAAAVWERMITAPDDSTLDIYRRGTKIGYCRWIPRVDEEPTPIVATEPANADAPEGRVRRITGYTLTLDGNFLVGDEGQRLRFSGSVELDARQNWRKLSVRGTVRPNTVEVVADAAKETVTFRMGDDPKAWQQTFAFKDLSQPEAVLNAFGVPLPPGTLQSLMPGGRQLDPAKLSLGLNWEARSDWLKIGSTRTRVYRLKARLFDKYEATALISRVGEILRLELPESLILANDALPLNLTTEK